MRTINEIELDIESINHNIESNSIKLKERQKLVEFHQSMVVNYKEELERLYSHLDEEEELLYNLKN